MEIATGGGGLGVNIKNPFKKASKEIRPGRRLHDPQEFRKRATVVLKAGGGYVSIYERGAKASDKDYIEDIALEDAADGNILQYLKEEHGNGRYVLEIYNQTDERDSTKDLFEFQIGKSKRRKTEDGADRKGKKNVYEEVFIETFKELVKSRGNGLESLDKVLDVSAKLQGDSKGFKDDLISLLLQNQLSGQSDPMQQLSQIYDFAEKLHSKEQQDPLSSLAQGVASMWAASQMKPAALADPSRALAEAVPQASLPTPPGAGMSAPSSAPLDPGAGTDGGDLSPGDQPPPVSVVQPQEENQHQLFYNLMVGPFRSHVTQGYPVESLASEIISMVQWSTVWTPENPHPLVAGLVQAGNPFELNAAFSSFCAAIPELSTQKQVQESLRAYFTAWIAKSLKVSEQMDLGDAEDDETLEPEESLEAEESENAVDDQTIGAGLEAGEQDESDPREFPDDRGSHVVDDVRD